MTCRWICLSGCLWVVACGGESTTDGSGGGGSGASSGGGGSGAMDGGSGGTAAGGAGGALGGAPGGGGAPCSALAQAYDEKVKVAKGCNPILSSVQCTLQIADALDCPCATTFVNPDNGAALATLNELTVQWNAQKCSEGIACPAIACEPPVFGACEEDASTGKASCQDMFKNGG